MVPTTGLPSENQGPTMMHPVTAGQTRLSRRPFGPRLHLRDGAVHTDEQNPTSSVAHGDPQIPAIPWVYYPPDSIPNDFPGIVPKPMLTGHPNIPKRRRPLLPKPRNYLNDSRRRPLPSTTVRSDASDIPFLFSSRSSHFPNADVPDPIKDPFRAPEGIPSDDPIWKNYADEAKQQDQTNINNWNQSMDVILIFAGLFSAILTAFLIEFYHPLQPDQQQIAADQLIIITHLLRASLSGQNPSNLASLDTGDSGLVFQVPGTVIGVNVLWFVSLTCSLGAAIGAMVIKQWLQFYTLGLSPNPYEFAHQHQYRYNALVSWHVPAIISALPFIMLFSVGLFLVGLGLQLLELHLSVAIPVISFMATVLLCYCLSLVLSIIYPACPYKTSGMVLLQSIGLSIDSVLHWCYGKRAAVMNSMREENIEIKEIRNHQPELVVNGISWLLGVSQQEHVIHNALQSVSKISHTNGMVQKLQTCNALEQLVQRAIVPLPPLGHEFWNNLALIQPSHSIFLKFSQARMYMKNLISVWHHPSYLAPGRPPAVSESHDLDRQTKVQKLKNSSGKKRRKEHQIDVENYMDAFYTCLLGDWLLFWRLLKQENNNKLLDLAKRGYDLNMYADIVCTEVCHYHLQKNVTPLYLPQNRGAFIDLHDLLWAIHETGQEQLGLEDDSVWLLLDTLAYVFSGIDNAPLELRGLPRAWFSPSQSPSLMRKETVLLLVQLLETNNMRYNLITKKILLCLQMLLPVPMISSSRRAFFIQYQQDSPSEKELFEQMNMTLEGLLYVFIPQLNKQSQGIVHADMRSDLFFKIGSLALRQLIYSILRAETPTTHHDTIFLHLPAAYTDNILTYFLSLATIKGRTYHQISWMHDLLIKWYQNGNLSNTNVEMIIRILIQTFTPTWTDSELRDLLKKTFHLLGELWKNPDPFLGNLVSQALCDILQQSFNQELDDRKILGQFIGMQALVAVAVFLNSEECTKESRQEWIDLILSWEKRINQYTPSAQEVFQLDSLKKAARREVALP